MTIEERAKEYAGKTGFREGGYYWQRRFDAYIKGATEQKAIDDERIAELEKEKALLLLEVNNKNKRIAELIAR